MSNKRKLERPKEDRSTAVAVAWVHRNQVDYSFFHSLMQLIGYDNEHEGRVWRGGFVAQRGGTGDLAAARNKGVRDFLADDKADWLMWVDTDMGFEPDTIDRLMEVADPTTRPIVGALCFAQREDEQDGVGGYRPITWPVVMDWNVVNDRAGWQIRWDYPRNTVTQVHGTGSACVLIHRSVFERIRDEYGPEWCSWYTRVLNPTTGELVGEDLSFCLRVMRLEIPMFVHTGVQTTHLKPIWLSEVDYWRQRALTPEPEPQPQMTEWPVPRFAIVPTHNRPERLAALVASLGSQADHIVVLDNASEPPVDVEALKAVAGRASVEVIRDEQQPPNISRFWNVMFDRCAELAAEAGQEKWDVASFNDDSIVPAGWYDVCATALREHATAVIAHTGTSPVHRPDLVTDIGYERHRRMCPWAYVIRGEAGMRADESLAWWFGDDDLNRRAALAGGVLAVAGPLAINAHAVESTVGELAEQAKRDQATFEAKWSAHTYIRAGFTPQDALAVVQDEPPASAVTA